MKRQILITIGASLLMAACTRAPAPAPHAVIPAQRPLDTLPGDADLELVRSDLFATAAQRFGSKAVVDAIAAPNYLIAKRFMGMAPPPPAGAGPDWVAPTPSALMMKGENGWMIATKNGWREAKAEGSEIDRVIADAEFWREEPAPVACPDYGASLLVLKTPGRAEIVRNSRCPSMTEKVILAALRG